MKGHSGIPIWMHKSWFSYLFSDVFCTFLSLHVTDILVLCFKFCFNCLVVCMRSRFVVFKESSPYLVYTWCIPGEALLLNSVLQDVWGVRAPTFIILALLLFLITIVLVVDGVYDLIVHIIYFIVCTFVCVFSHTDRYFRIYRQGLG